MCLHSHVSVDDAVHDKDHDALQSCEDAEQPLHHLCIHRVPHHKEAQRPRQAEDGEQHCRRMEQRAVSVCVCVCVGGGGTKS